MYLGIDFGTSYSQASTMYMGQPTLLLNPGEYGIPSEFYYDGSSGILIGQDAVDAGQGTAAANLVSEVKMDILASRTYTLDRRTFTTQQIVGEIYKALVQRAQRMARRYSLDPAVQGIVISIPAKFGIQERYLIKEAAQTCLPNQRLAVRGIIKEPVAAAIAYYNQELLDGSLKNGRNILVYDLGGGTCDVALVRSDSSVAERFTVVDSDMLRLGGRDWDRALMGYIGQEVERQSGRRIAGNVAFEEKVRRAAIKVKHDLSDPYADRSVARVELNGRVFRVSVTRSAFDEITSDLLRQTLDCLEEVYNRNVASCRIDEIICVGGSSNMLQVEEGLTKRFGDECRIRLFEPEHAVVNGATLFANMGGGVEDLASFSYGSDTNTHYGFPDNRRIVRNIIFQGEQLPVVRSRGFRPVRDGQDAVTFNIYESESSEDSYDLGDPHKRFVGKVRLTLPPNASKNLELRCQIGLSKDGLLEVKASEPSGRQVKASFVINSL